MFQGISLLLDILFKTLRHKLTEMLQHRSGHKCYLKYNDITGSDDQSQE